MGMLDQQLIKFSDHFKLGQTFKLEDARHGPTIDTEYGEGTPVMFKINGSWYSLFGQALNSQIDRMDDTDRAAMRDGRMMVKVATAKTKRGNTVKLLVPATTETDEAGNIVSQEETPF